MAIVAAVGIATAHRSGEAMRIEGAMKKALADALSQGVTDPVQLKNIVLLARAAAKKALKQ